MLEFYERVSGARMHANYVRPGGVAYVSNQFLFSLFLIPVTKLSLKCLPFQDFIL